MFFSSEGAIMRRTITRTYDNYSDARAAITDLKAAGIPEERISVLAHDGQHSDEMLPDDETLPDDEMLPAGGSSTGTGATVGATLGGGAGLLTGLGLMAIPGVGPLVAAGWLATMAAGAVSGAMAGAAAGGIVGALTDNGVDKKEAETYAEALRRGSTLVSVRVDEGSDAQVQSIMDRHNPTDLTSRRAKWEEDGWMGYDPAAKPYAADERRTEMDRWL
jgi:hypothetical protein